MESEKSERVASSVAASPSQNSDKQTGAAESGNAAIKTDFAVNLERADEYVAGTNFGHVTRFMRPFSRQMKTDIRNRFPIDEAVYDEADRLQKETARHYTAMRGFTAVFFLCLCVAAVMSNRAMTREYYSLFGLEIPRIAATTGILVLWGAILVVLRWVARKFFMDLLIDKAVDKLAYTTGNRCKDISGFINDACTQIGIIDAKDTGLNWAESASGWCKIALWNTKRNDNLDRYTTAVFWKVQVFNQSAETFSRMLKALFLFAAVFLLHSHGTDGWREWGAHSHSNDLILFVWLGGCYLLFSNDAIAAVRSYVGSAVLVATCVMLLVYWSSLGREAAADPVALISAIVLAVFFWYGWIVSDLRTDEYWTVIFSREFRGGSDDQKSRRHYFNVIARQIGNLVNQILQAHRIPSGAGNAQTKP
jgi:hypothetical protein